jgi:flagellar biosynthesis protein FlhG
LKNQADRENPENQRQRKKAASFERETRMIAISSGKGGVGKSSVTVNLALALILMKQKVLILDADMGLANIDVLLGVSPVYNLTHVVFGHKSFGEIICEGPMGIRIIPGGSGVSDLADLQDWELQRFLSKMETLNEQADFFLIDTGAGIAKNVLSFILASNELIVITTPEPTSLTDAYGLIKTVWHQNFQGGVKILVNRAGNPGEALNIYKKLSMAVTRFLEMPIEYLGCIREDPRVIQTVRDQKLFLAAYPDCGASKDMTLIASKLINADQTPNTEEGLQGFFSKVVSFFR